MIDDEQRDGFRNAGRSRTARSGIGSGGQRVKPRCDIPFIIISRVITSQRVRRISFGFHGIAVQKEFHAANGLRACVGSDINIGSESKIDGVSRVQISNIEIAV